VSANPRSVAGSTVLITGAASGMGRATAELFAAEGAHVALTDIAAESVREAADDLVHRGFSAEAWTLDVADAAAIEAVVAEAAARFGGLDILVNNAGVMAIPYRQTADGFEMQFGTNHLGHFALTGLLIDPLRARPGARVVTVTSLAAHIGRIDFDDLQHTRRYHRWAAYGQAKLANQLFTLELDRRSRAAGYELVSVAAHPGYAATNLQTTGPALRGSRLGVMGAAAANRLFAQSDSQGALPSLYGATADGVRGGEYYGPGRLLGRRGQPTRVRPPRAARDAETARRLWQVSEQLTGVHFGGIHQRAV
jgi:NAD(P)-dependent dehydrogenase (short-subunit alcohol dehydrogenase family)